MPPEFLYFDMGEVLLPFSHERAIQQMASVTGLADTVVRNLVFSTQGLEWQFERGDISAEDFLKQLAAAGGDVSNPRAIARANSDIFEINASIIPLLTSLFCSGHRVGVFSNTSSWHWEFARRKYTILSLFEQTALSYELQAMKPEPQIYPAAAELAGVAPEKIFFVDDRQENVDAALAAGWQAVLYTSAVKLRQDLKDRGVRFNL